MSLNNITKVAIIRFAQSFHLYMHAFSLILIDRGLSLFQITAIESIVIGTVFFMEIPTGVISDRIGYKWSIALAMLLLAVAEVIFLFAESYPVYIFHAIITGIGLTFVSGTVEAFIYDSLPQENHDHLMVKAMGTVNSSSRIAFFFAPIVGAFIIGAGSLDGYYLSIALTGVALLIGMIVSLTLKEPRSNLPDEKPDSLTILKESIRELRNNTDLRRLVMLAIFTSPMTSILVMTFAAPFLTQNGISPFVIGLTVSIGNLLSAVTQRYAYKLEEWLGETRTLHFLMFLPGVLYGILALTTGSIFPVIIITLMYGINDMKLPLFAAYENSMIHDETRATVLSIIHMFLNLFIAIVAPIYAIIGTFSLPLAFVLIGTVIMFATILLRTPHLALDGATGE